MSLTYTDTIFHDHAAGFHHVQDVSCDLAVYCHMCFVDHRHKDIKSRLFSDMINDINKALREEKDIEQMKTDIEGAVHEINKQIDTCNYCLTGDEKLVMKGCVQILYKNEYICSMLGEMSMLVLRGDSVHYMLSNESLEGSSSSFSKLIDGEVENCDRIYFFGKDIFSYFQIGDITYMIDMSHESGKPFDEILLESICRYISKDDLGYMSTSLVNMSSLFNNTY